MKNFEKDVVNFIDEGGFLRLEQILKLIPVGKTILKAVEL